MIPAIYAENETNFAHNGLGLLVDTIYCYPEEIRNSNYEVELAYPIFSEMYKEIKANRWIKAKANDRYESQLFRIYYISKPIGGKITVKAEHISYLLKDNFVETLSYTGNCNTVLNALNSAATFPTGFTFYSDVTTSKSFSFDLRNFWECIIGKDDSVISQFGTGIDIVRNNKNISLMQNGGQDNNVLIAYRKNLTGFTLEEDWTGCVTKIYPYATQNDVRITVPERYVNSQYIGRDPNPRIDKIDFTNEFSDGETITADTLRQKAINYFINTQCDVPNLNYNIEFVALSKTEEYRNFALNEGISLLDYVIVRHELYGIDTKIKVIKAKYDSLVETYIKLELGFIKNTITNLIKDTNKKIAEADKKIDDTKTELKEDISEANAKTDNLKVVMEASDSQIELSVSNLKTDTEAQFLVQDGLISSKVNEADFGTLIEQNSRSVVVAIHGESDNKVTVNSNGLTVTGGGFLFENTNGDDILLAIPSGGIRIGNDSWSKDTSMDMISLGGSPLGQYFLLSNITVESSLDMCPYSTHEDITGVGHFDARYAEIFDDAWVDGTLACGRLECNDKHGYVDTDGFGRILVNAYETAEYYFGDIGGGTIIDGECIILLDPKFQECVNSDIEYQVDIYEYQKRGSITDVEKHQNYFIVKGIDYIEFGWEIKVKAKGKEDYRLELSKSNF